MVFSGPVSAQGYPGKGEYENKDCDSDVVFCGIGEGEDEMEARKIAQNDLVSRLVTRVSGEFRSEEDNKGRNYNKNVLHAKSNELLIGNDDWFCRKLNSGKTECITKFYRTDGNESAYREKVGKLYKGITKSYEKTLQPTRRSKRSRYPKKGA